MHPLQKYICTMRDSTFQMALNRPIIHTYDDTHSGPLLLYSRHQQQQQQHFIKSSFGFNTSLTS